MADQNQGAGASESEVVKRLKEWCYHNDREGVETRTTTDVQALVIDHTRLLARVQELEAELNKVRKQTHTQMRDEIEATWTAIENGFDIEPRAYFEKEAPTNGFRFALVQAMHYLWKRDAKVQELEREVGRFKDGYAKIDIILGERATGDDRSIFERLEALVREVAELKKAAPDLIREHRKAYYDQIDCWKGEPTGPCQCPACKMERLT